MRKGIVAPGIVLLLAASGCSDEVVFDSSSSSTGSTTGTATGPTTSASTTSGSPTTASSGAGGSGGEGAGGGGGSGCDAIHVAPGGDDTATGCADAPLGSVDAAVTRAGQEAIATVRVCEGTFEEDVTLGTSALTLSGSLDCDTWEPLAGPPSTRVIGRGGAPATVTISGDATVTVEGFAIVGVDRERDAGTSVALLVEGGDHVVRDCTAEGGRSDGGDSIGSIGVRLTSSSARLERVTGLGGPGTSVGTAGSVGILVEDGAPLLSQVVARGGSGIGASGSVGIWVTGSELTGPFAIVGLDADGGTGQTRGDGFGALGLRVSDLADVEIEGATIVAGAGRLVPPDTFIDCSDKVLTRPTVNGFGVHAATGARLTMVRSRVLGGAETLAHSNLGIYGGIRVVGADVTVEDSLIVAGSAAYAADPADDSCYATGRSLYVGGDSNVSVLRSTLITAGPGQLANLWLDSATSLSVEDSLLVAQPSEAGQVGWALAWTGSCSRGLFGITSFSRNALVPRGTLSNFGCAGAQQADVPALAAVLATDTPGASIAGTFEVRADCQGRATCATVPACSASEGCLAALFAEGDWADGGAAALLDDALALAPDTIPCRIAEGIESCDGTDAVGDRRTPRCSIGGRENDLGCVPP